jgi:AcrR family transcriptional regulator
MTTVIVKGACCDFGLASGRGAAVAVMAAKPELGRTLPPRQRMVRSAAQLIRRQGVSGTGMREIVADAGAPRGSLQHYFPGGKEELIIEAVRWMGGIAAKRVGRHLPHLEPSIPSVLLAALVDDWRDDLTSAGFTAGCPLVAAAADSAASSPAIREVLRQEFDGWLEALRAALVDLGVPAERGPGLASLVVSALEGAIILCRTRGDLAPFDALVAELGPVLDAAREGAAPEPVPRRKHVRRDSPGVKAPR